MKIKFKRIERMQERKKLEDIIKELPQDLRKELEDFAQFLWGKQEKKKS
jgi:hypothetical protein